jgi:N-formylglutamate amidohydrolase
MIRLKRAICALGRYHPPVIFEVVPGAPRSPVILHVPHASREITPAARSTLLVDDEALADELDNLTDAHTDLIAARAAALATPRPWQFVNRWSRLVVDPERFPDDREEMRAVGMGAVYTRGYAGRKLRDADPVRDQEALQTHYRPYADALAALVAERLEATGRAVIIDVHSYPLHALPYELHAAGPRPPVCLGTDDFHTPPALLEAAGAAFAEFGVGWNTPFAGCYVPLDRYRTDSRVTAVMVELRRDGYMPATPPDLPSLPGLLDPPGLLDLPSPPGPPPDGLTALAGALATLVSAVS